MHSCRYSYIQQLYSTSGRNPSARSRSSVFTPLPVEGLPAFQGKAFQGTWLGRKPGTHPKLKAGNGLDSCK